MQKQAWKTLFLLSLGPPLAPQGHTSTSLVGNTGVDSRCQPKSVASWLGAIWTRAEEPRMNEGLGLGAAPHTVISWTRMMSVFPSVCIPRSSRNWWFVCLEYIPAVASMPLSRGHVTGSSTYRLAVGGLPIHVSAGWSQVVPVSALVVS